MICYQCGVRLSEHDFCTGCGADVALYKRILSASNRLYNEGLEKAGVRDLAGAVFVLKQSLKYNKNNIKARNLLGLCYFETGEAVAALSEWVISKNIRPTKNIADDYIRMIQENQARLDTINQTLKKFNQAVAYCWQDSHDLAIIQLKKVLSNNAKYVRAHQLLALLYIGEEEWNLAKNELQKCSEIDANNTITLRYLQEVNKMMMPEDLARAGGKQKTSDEAVRYVSGNETIIQPARRRDFRVLTTIFNIGIGIAIGIAISISLILPSRLQQAQTDAAEQVRVISEEMDLKTAAISELERQVARFGDDNTALAAELDDLKNADLSPEMSDSLLLAASALLIGPLPPDGGGGEEDDLIQQVAAYLDPITEEEMSEASPAFTELYASILKVAGVELGDFCFANGYEYYQAEEYAGAIPHLAKAFQYDRANSDAIWYLANAYDRNGEMDRARDAYGQVIESFPGTDKATRSEERLVELNITGS